MTNSKQCSMFLCELRGLQFIFHSGFLFFFKQIEVFFLNLTPLHFNTLNSYSYLFLLLKLLWFEHLTFHSLSFPLNSITFSNFEVKVFDGMTSKNYIQQNIDECKTIMIPLGNATNELRNYEILCSCLGFCGSFTFAGLYPGLQYGALSATRFKC